MKLLINFALTDLQLLGKLLPFVVSEGGEVEVDEFGAELGELVVQADRIIPPGGGVLFVLGAGLPRIRVNHLSVGAADGKPDGSVPA